MHIANKSCAVIMAGSSTDTIGVSLVDQMEDALPAGKSAKGNAKKRVLKKMNTDEVVEKVMRETLKDLTPVQKYVLKSKDGLTCEETLRRDKKARRSGDRNMVFGKTYYDGIRLAYADTGATQSLLHIKDESQACPRY